MKDCTTCKYGYEDERLGIPMCHHPKRFSKDCVDFNMHEEKETKESEKHVPNDLEEAVRKYQEGVPVDTTIHYCGADEDVYFANHIVDAFIAGAKWQKEQMMKDGNVILSEEDFDAEKEKSVEWGYSLCKEQMMKEAIHYVVQDDLDSHGASYNIPFIRIGIAALKPKGIGVGDKVRIIIVKED